MPRHAGAIGGHVREGGPARSLAKEVDIGKPVPTKWYQAVAEVLAMVYRLKKAG